MTPKDESFKPMTKVVFIIVLGYLLGVAFLYEATYNKEIERNLTFRPPKG